MALFTLYKTKRIATQTKCEFLNGLEWLILLHHLTSICQITTNMFISLGFMLE